MQEVSIRRISVGTVFTLVGVGLLFSLLPFTILMGCTAALGLNTLSWNNQPLTGWTALVAAPFEKRGMRKGVRFTFRKRG